MQYKDDPVDADDTKETFFCPEEANPKDRATLVSIGALSKKVARSGAGKKLLVVDACRNEVTAKGNKALEEELDPVGRRARTEQAGMYSLFSCAPKEKSWEHPELKHGVFTSQLIKYLDGQADAALYPRQQISIQQLAAYASRETTEFVYKRLNQEQSPELRGQGTDWSLGRLGGLLKEITSRATGMKLALIPAGTFTMGSPASEAERSTDEGPTHTVRISQPFYMGLDEVTQGEYESVMGTNPSGFSKTGMSSSKVSGMNTSRFPVEKVSWDDAAEFCQKLSVKDGVKYRLPTEAEWEYAARAGTTTFHFGSTLNGDKANVDGNSPYGTTADPKVTSGSESRVLRGGSWGSDS